MSSQQNPQQTGIRGKLEKMTIFQDPNGWPLNQILLDPNAEKAVWLQLSTANNIANSKNKHQAFPESLINLSDIFKAEAEDSMQSAPPADPIEQRYKAIILSLDRLIKGCTEIRERVTENMAQFQSKSVINKRDLINSLFQKIVASPDLAQQQYNLYKLASYLEPKDKTFKFVYNSRIFQRAKESSTQFCNTMQDLLKKVNSGVEEVIKISSKEEIPKYVPAEMVKFEIDKLDFGDITKSAIVPFDELNTVCQLFDRRQIKTKLLYRATDDGWIKFHEQCDKIAPTLIICQSNHGQIFGGYTEIPWSDQNTYNTDQRAFLFSISNQAQLNVKINDNATFNANSWGPRFGGASDLAISTGNNGAGSYSDLGHSYETPQGIQYNTNESQSYLAGAFQFTLVNYQVYQITIL